MVQRRTLARLLFVSSLSGLVGCAALLGVDLDPTLQRDGATLAEGDGGASTGTDPGDPDVTPDGCTRKSCAELGVRCGQPDDGCGGTRTCEDCGGGCTPTQKEVACMGRCGAIADGCSGHHDCGLSACGDGGTTCFEGQCCTPTFECGAACGVTLDRGCGLGSLDCPGPAPGDTFVCHEGIRCEPHADCGSQCGTLVDDGCGNLVGCPDPVPPAVCYQGTVCFPMDSCEGRCNVSVDPGCGLPLENCFNTCGAGQCCGAGGFCEPSGGGRLCDIQPIE